MSKPDIQYFGRDGTWVRPDRAAAVDVVVQAGGGGSAPGRDGEDGGIAVKRFYAPKIPPTVDIEIGKGGRPGGRDGYVLVVTHLADDGSGQPSPWDLANYLELPGERFAGVGGS